MTAGLDEATTQAVVEDYEQAQLRALKAGLLAAALIALASLAFTKDLPRSIPAGGGGGRGGRVRGRGRVGAGSRARLV